MEGMRNYIQMSSPKDGKYVAYIPPPAIPVHVADITNQWDDLSPWSPEWHLNPEQFFWQPLAMACEFHKPCDETSLSCFWF